MLKRNITEHPYKDTDDPEYDLFEVYQTDEGWFWSFSPVYRDPGPFETEAEAIIAGENFLDENGKHI